MKKIRGIIEASKFHGIPTFLRNLCFEYDLELDINIDSGWICQTIRYSISGPEDIVDKVHIKINKIMATYEEI